MQQKPNILFILIDDMGWRDLSCSGSEFYETPVIDELRSEGMFFTDAYSACPVCSPTRASILTGRYPADLGLTDWIDMEGTYHPCRGRLIDAPYIKHMPAGEKTIAQELKEQGYSAWHVGKWHLGGREYYPEQFGFDVNIGGCDWGHPHEGYFSPYHIETLPDGPEGEFLTDRLTDEAIGLLEKQDADHPFYLNLCYYDVHIPIQAKPDDIVYFEKKAGRLGLDRKKTFEMGEPFPTDQKRNQKITRRLLQSDPVYAALIYNLDRNIGRLLGALERLGRKENTLIFFTSDNGGLATSEGSPTCNFPASEGKGWMYEGGMRVPFLTVWDGRIRPGSVCNTPMTSIDFYPTMLEAAGGNKERVSAREGFSLVPLLEETGELPERPIFWHYPHYGNQGGTPGASVRLGEYKLIEFFEDGHTELYNLVQDVEEKEDLTGKLPEKSRELLKLLHEWQERVNAQMPAVNPDYKG
ncbi:sulfatase [Anaerolentibacter hominis]|uniref:sulfatase n=1 Tax=Anaerolentibacter hominis TaxID=3079009 RepID=UPI0031B83A9A